MGRTTSYVLLFSCPATSAYTCRRYPKGTKNASFSLTPVKRVTFLPAKAAFSVFQVKALTKKLNSLNNAMLRYSLNVVVFVDTVGIEVRCASAGLMGFALRTAHIYVRTIVPRLTLANTPVQTVWPHTRVRGLGTLGSWNPQSRDDAS